MEVVSQRTTVVTALPLKKAARERLAELLQARVIDIRDPFDRVDLVLTPSCSPQLIGALKRKYDGARVMIVELDDWEFDIALPGPVKRLLKSGADGYLLADSIDELAQKIAPRHGQAALGAALEDVHELPQASTVDDVIAAFLRESESYAERLQPVEEHRRDD